MAWRRGYFKSRVRGFANRVNYKARSGYYRRGGMKGIAGMSLPFIGGAVAGAYAPRLHAYQDPAIIALAVLPIRLPYRLKGIAQGYVLGMLIRQFLPPIGGFTPNTENSIYV